MNKYLLLTAVLVSALSLSGATGEGEGRRKLDTQTGKLSVRLLLDDWRAGFARKEFAPGMERIRKEMEKDPAHNVSLREAKSHARAWFTDELRRSYRAEVEKILKPFAASLSAAEMEKFRSGEERFFEERSRTLFESGFAGVRKRLVEEQKKQLFRRIYPTPEELESMNDIQLARLLETRFRKGLNVPLWEENAPLIRREVVEPAIRSGRVQQKKQLALLQQTAVPLSLWETPEVEEHLLQELNRTLAAQFPDQAERYGLFPATKKKLHARAEHIGVERVIARLPRNLQTDRYKEILKHEPEKHREPEQSFKLISAGFQRGLIQSSIEEIDAPKKLIPALRRNKEVQKAAERRFRELAPLLQSERWKFAFEQLREYWQELADGKWVPEMEETQIFAASGSKDIPELKKRPKTAPLLREGEKKAEALIRKAFAAEVKRLENQRECVKAVYSKVLDSMEQKQNSLEQGKSWFSGLFASSNLKFDDVVKAYRKEVVSDSSEPLFPVVENEIEVYSRAILQRVLTPAAVKKNSSSSQALEERILTLRLSGKGENLTLSCGKWKYTFAPPHFSASGAAAELQNQMMKQKKPAVFRIRLVVANDRIYYKDVALIREALKKVLKNCKLEDALQK